ncbi:septal ring lytic transglycosylase RlpA family protein [Marinomonas spartinae]|uniref:septal ring lytic transglycosylase RlpA family protein n=1 Tax=Marinomonas spartinae TaxID=1792290 RepID=UPI0018F22EDC|nr:septal ring lytic transglycosylase RlpA family protein [Marinomonas spartinae]MBJ7554919.1 septal ring lytic transglycosylase RlpA family protein [Marinomonas spartinae]
MLKITVVSWIVLPLLLSACASAPMTHSESRGFVEYGKASYYADKYQGRKTANGERFNQHALTAAHKRLAFGSRVKVINLANGKSVVVRINDRGPYTSDRIIDLSKAAFKRIANIHKGVINVKIIVLSSK